LPPGEERRGISQSWLGDARHGIGYGDAEGVGHRRNIGGYLKSTEMGGKEAE
jgi:hypothetical protein